MLLHLVSYWGSRGTNLTAVWHVPGSSLRIFWRVPKILPPTLSNGQMLIIMDKLLDLCNILRSSTGQGLPFVVIISWCSTSLESLMSHKYLYLTNRLLTKHLSNICQGFCNSLSKTGKFEANLLLYYICPENHHLSSARSQANEHHFSLCKTSTAPLSTPIHTTC